MSGAVMREAVIERLGLRGDGLAAGGLRVPLSLPGERVRGAVDADGRMSEPEVLTASPRRVAPPCRHFGSCGGCQLQHADPDLLAAWKRDTIAGALAAQGVAAGEIRPTLSSPTFSRRRVVLAGRRTRRSVLLGFHGRRSETVVDVTDCLVADPAIMTAREGLARLAALGAGRSREVRLTVIAGPAGLDVDLRGGKALDAGLRAALAQGAETADLARLSWDGETLALRRQPVQRMGAALVVPPPGAFLQATPQGEEALVAAVREAVGGARRIADLFAGCGTFALPLADNAEVHAVEGEAAMLAALDAGWRRAPGLHRVSTETRDIARRPLRAEELAGFDAAIIDPPRAGAAAQTAEIARSRLSRLASVSCNPVSFARDARELAGAGFRLDWVQPVDQFLWSGHVELAALFSR
jgi:23S rRNA (uracil1939-C5)-methyltransferase